VCGTPRAMQALSRVGSLARRVRASHVAAAPSKCDGCAQRRSDVGQGPSDAVDPLARRSFYQRELPERLVSFSSREGKRRFLEAVGGGTAEGYFPLSEQFITQGEPAFCGPSCLAMVLNALRIDPNTTWKGGWRWYDEHTLAASCCKPLHAITAEGITLDEFAALGRCQGARVEVRPKKSGRTEKAVGAAAGVAAAAVGAAAAVAAAEVAAGAAAAAAAVGAAAATAAAQQRKRVRGWPHRPV